MNMRRYEIPGTPIPCFVVDPLSEEERKKKNQEIFRSIRIGLQILAEEETEKVKGK